MRCNMAKRKKEINFIAAQKAIGKTGQSTSFEFILVVTVIVAACAMVGWYLAARSQYNDAVAELDSAKTTLKNEENILKNNEKKFKEFRIKTDENGKYIVIGTNSDGSSIYEYESLIDVAKQTATALANAQATSTEMKGVIDLTTTVLDLIYISAKNAACTVNEFTLSRTNITVSFTAETQFAMTSYYDYLRGKSVISFYTGCKVTDYLSGVSISNTKPLDEGKYSFTISCTLINDKLFDNSEAA